MKHKTSNKQAKFKHLNKKYTDRPINLVFENIVTSNIPEMLWEVIPHFSSCGAERPSAVSACSYLGDFYSLCIPKRIRKILKS